jgi:hypothetical protein
MHAARCAKLSPSMWTSYQKLRSRVTRAWIAGPSVRGGGDDEPHAARTMVARDRRRDMRSSGKGARCNSARRDHGKAVVGLRMVGVTRDGVHAPKRTERIDSEACRLQRSLGGATTIARRRARLCATPSWWSSATRRSSRGSRATVPRPAPGSIPTGRDVALTPVSRTLARTSIWCSVTPRHRGVRPGLKVAVGPADALLRPATSILAIGPPGPHRGRRRLRGRRRGARS